MYNIKNIIWSYFASLEHYKKYYKVVTAYNNLFFSDQQDITWFYDSQLRLERFHKPFNFRIGSYFNIGFTLIFDGPDFITNWSIVQKYKKLHNRPDANTAVTNGPLPRNYYYSICNLKEYCNNLLK